MSESEMLSFFDFEPLLGKQSEERIEVMGLLFQGFINGNSQKLSVRRFTLKAVPLVISGAATLRICNYRQLMLGADQIAEPCYSFA